MAYSKYLLQELSIFHSPCTIFATIPTAHSHLDQSHHSCNRRCQTSGKATRKARKAYAEKDWDKPTGYLGPPHSPNEFQGHYHPSRNHIWGMGT